MSAAIQPPRSPSPGVGGGDNVQQAITSSSSSSGAPPQRIVDASMISSHENNNNNNNGTSTTTTSLSITDASRGAIASSSRTSSPPSIGLQHVKEFMRNSTHFSTVTQEQIDRVRFMHDRFQEGCHFSFNYNTLLTVASILAGLGLVSNSPTTVIASMLVSPIMGPVVGIAYGATIWDWRLCKTALKTELISLVFCILIGIMIGAICGSLDLADSWPTEEIRARANYQSLFVALPVAFFSGLGVAVSLLDEQTSSLVGVAISASLLPPAVNAGIIWVGYGFYERRRQEEEGDGNNANVVDDVYPDASTDVDGGYTRDQFRLGGIISLTLTLANVVLIIIASMIMFRMKERLPIKKKVFWDDLGVARKIYRNLAYLSDSDIDTDEDDNIVGSGGDDDSSRSDEEEAVTSSSKQQPRVGSSQCVTTIAATTTTIASKNNTITNHD